MRTITEFTLCGTLWTFDSKEDGIATSEDGRLLVFQMGEILVMPAPAADLWADIRLRDAVRGE